MFRILKSNFIVKTLSISFLSIFVALGSAAAPADSCRTWNDFAAGTQKNVLPDFSYAGYDHGESAPPAAESLGYKVFNVCDYGAVPSDGKSDRDAFIRALEAAGARKAVRQRKNSTAIQLTGPGKNAGMDAVIYFPEGVYDMQCDSDEVNEVMLLDMGNLIIRGAGRDRTTLRMTLGNELVDPKKLWTTPTMIVIGPHKDFGPLTTVTGAAPEGSFSVEVASAAGIKAGDWVCLALKDNSPELVAAELAPFSSVDLVPNASIVKDGVEVCDIHQVKSVDGNTVTFVEPIMHAVDPRYKWEVKSFRPRQNVGVEDLCFEGRAKDKFRHHATGADDGAFKLIDFTRLANSYARRLDFRSVSEAMTIDRSANVSAYDIHIGGTRGHSAVRSNYSSRVFIGKVVDESSGYVNEGGRIVDIFLPNAGQFHACGVAKPSIGTVIWNVQWGDDACFESHATQPRATLIDHCRGAFLTQHQGGAESQLPNHLNDLVIWNMDATKVKGMSRWKGKFYWWDAKDRWWKVLNPVIVGFHGQPVEFGETMPGETARQYKRIESIGQAVEPASLYEAQLQRRLGYLPGWITDLK